MADEVIRNEEAAETAAKKGGLLDNKLALLGVIVVLQALTAFAVIKFVVVPRLAVADPGRQDVTAVDEGEGILVDVGEMVVTLRDSGPNPEFLRIDVNLDLNRKKAADQAAKRLPQLRDTIILTLSNKTGRELRTLEGKEALKVEIADKVGAILGEGSLRNVFFSDLVVQ